MSLTLQMTTLPNKGAMLIIFQEHSQSLRLVWHPLSQAGCPIVFHSLTALVLRAILNSISLHLAFVIFYKLSFSINWALVSSHISYHDLKHCTWSSNGDKEEKNDSFNFLGIHKLIGQMQWGCYKRQILFQLSSDELADYTTSPLSPPSSTSLILIKAQHENLTTALTRKKKAQPLSVPVYKCKIHV